MARSCNTPSHPSSIIRILAQPRRANHSAAAKTCPPLAGKIFRLTRRANQRYQLVPSHPTRRALRTTRHAGRVAEDDALAKHERKRQETADDGGTGAPALAVS